MVAGADCWLAQADIPGRRGLTRVTCNDLPQPLYPSPQCSKKGITRALATHPEYAPVAPSRAKDSDNGRITDTVSISERAAPVEDRALPGHWGGDLLFGSHNCQTATLVERQTRYVMLLKIGGKDTESVINALIMNARKLPQELYKSLTWDRDKEMADHKRFTLDTHPSLFL